MYQLTRALLIVTATVIPVLGHAESPSAYIEQVSCERGAFGLRLPQRLPEVMKLGTVKREEILGVEKWDSYSTTRTYVYFDGLTLGLVTFSNEPNRYLVSHAEITGPQWSKIAPFHIGESVRSIRRKLGLPANSDLDAKSSYGSEAGDISFQQLRGKITKITYACYTG